MPTLTSGWLKLADSPGNDEVGVHGQFAAAAPGQAVDRRDYGLGAGGDGLPQAMVGPQHHFDGAGLGHGLDVRSGGEDLGATGEDDAADGRIDGKAAEGLGQLLAHRIVEGVAHRLTVELDQRDMGFGEAE